MNLSESEQRQAAEVSRFIAERFGDVQPIRERWSELVELADDKRCNVLGGVVDHRALRAFSEGQCHAFAIAAHLRTGYPMVWLGEQECAYDESCRQYPEEWGWCGCQVTHLMVLRPDGDLWDITGTHKADAYLQRHGEENGLFAPFIGVVDTRMLSWTMTHESWRWPRVDVALSLVEASVHDR